MNDGDKPRAAGISDEKLLRWLRAYRATLLTDEELAWLVEQDQDGSRPPLSEERRQLILSKILEQAKSEETP